MKLRVAILAACLLSVNTGWADIPGAADIDALLGLYDTRPLVLSVFMDHPEWDSDPRVTDFVSAHLDQLPDAYKQSDIAPTPLLLLAAGNPSSGVQTKLDATVTDAVG